ncbi:MAG TPA: tetratricopeptide repeat protein [Candidatus Acidoferrales bacterium]|nr:tetratricopeptide repeat protein [Candidatus Acidoferrales bacterium]
MSARRIFLGLTLAAFGLCGAASAQSQSPVAPSEQPVANYNPALAKHDVEVGRFYLDKGDLDGAIARFKDAMHHKPNFAEPRLLLGQVYEKKNDPASAIDYYQQYLKILPNARDSKKVRARVAKLQDQISKDKAAANRSGKSL